MMTDRVGIGIPSGAELPVAHPPGHRSLRHARHVIVWLLLIVLAAVTYVLLDLVLASAGGLGPHPPGPLPHPVPNPTRPGTAGKLTGPEGRGRRARQTPPGTRVCDRAGKKGPSRHERLRLGCTAGPAGHLKTGCVGNQLLRSPTARKEQSHAQALPMAAAGPGSPVSRPAPRAACNCQPPAFGSSPPWPTAHSRSQRLQQSHRWPPPPR
jgi:hypothetical protein